MVFFLDLYIEMSNAKKRPYVWYFFFNILSTDLNTILFLFFAKPIVYVTTGNLFYSMKIFIDCLTLEFICPLVVIRRQTYTGRLFLLWNVCVCIWFFHSKLFSIFISASEKKIHIYIIYHCQTERHFGRTLFQWIKKKQYPNRQEDNYYASNMLL